MNVKTCGFNGCDAAVRISAATELGSVDHEDGTKTVLDVKYCDSGHTLDYIPRRIDA